MKMNKSNRKAQIQMGETMMIMIILIILLVVGLLFYGKLKGGDLEAKLGEVEELDIVKLSEVAYNLPEIQCTISQVADYGCIDKVRVEKLTAKLDKTGKWSDGPEYYYYRELFGKSTIRIEEYSIKEQKFKTIYMLYNYTQKAGITDNDNVSVQQINMPLIIHDPKTQLNSFGILKVFKYK